MLRYSFMGLVISTALSASAASADDSDTCTTMHDLAFSIMSARQNETPLPKMMGVVNDGGFSAGLRDAMRSLVLAAYEKPAYSTDEYKNREAQQFANQVYAICAGA